MCWVSVRWVDTHSPVPVLSKHNHFLCLSDSFSFLILPDFALHKKERTTEKGCAQSSLLIFCWSLFVDVMLMLC